MANQKVERQTGQRLSVPAQDDEADILEEANAERDEETGELVADAEMVRELGAADPETLREKRRLKQVVDKKKKGEKKVAFGTNDALVVYETLLQVWPATSVNVTVKRLSGTPMQEIVTSHPKSRTDLYAAIKNVIGQASEAEYEIKYHDTGGQWLGTGRLVMPNTLTQGQPAPPPYYQPNSGAAPQPTPAAPASRDQVTEFERMFEVFQRFSGAQPQAQQPFSPTPQPQQLQSPGMDDMTRMFEMFQRMQGVRGAPARMPQVPQQLPQLQPQSNSTDDMLRMFEMFQKMQERMLGSGQGPMHRGPRPPYYPQAQRDPNERPSYMNQHAPPQRAPSVSEQFRDISGAIRTAVALRDELDSLLPGRRERGGYVDDDESSESFDGPVRVEEVAGIKLLRNNDEQGTLRFWETLGTNVPGAVKWIGEKVNEARAEEKQRQQRQRLPPGYVEVGPGYQPPPGYVAVPVERQDDDLPPPPSRVPPPIQSTPWDTPEE